jgi:hypothetical protein
VYTGRATKPDKMRVVTQRLIVNDKYHINKSRGRYTVLVGVNTRVSDETVLNEHVHRLHVNDVLTPLKVFCDVTHTLKRPRGFSAHTGHVSKQCALLSVALKTTTAPSARSHDCSSHVCNFSLRSKSFTKRDTQNLICIKCAKRTSTTNPTTSTAPIQALCMI